MGKLTERQKKFCEEYLLDLNATKAAQRAGYSQKCNSTRLLEREAVQEYLSEQFRKMQEKAEISKEEVIRELGKIAFSNGCDFAKVIERKVIENGEEVSIHEMEVANIDKIPEEKRAAIANIKISKSGVSITPYDKMKALELLGKHFGLFQDKINNTASSQVQILDDIPKEKEYE